MLTTLLESGRRAHGVRKALPGSVLSLAAHAGVLFAAVMLTMPKPTVRRVIPTVLDSLDLFVPRPASPRVPKPPAGPVDIVPVAEPVGFPVPSAEVPVGIPPVDPDSPLFPLTSLGTGSTRELPWGRPGDGGGGDLGRVYREAVVDDPPRLVSSRPVEYPRLLHEAGVEGTVLIEVVIDTLGHPEAETLRAVESPHAEFTRAACRVVLEAVYLPGRIEGRRVRVLVRVPVAFRIAGRH
jgi:TonB family protein